MLFRSVSQSQYQAEGVAALPSQPATPNNVAQLQAFKSETLPEGTVVSNIQTSPMSVAENATKSEEKQTTTQINSPTILANTSSTVLNTGENPNSKRT